VRLQWGASSDAIGVVGYRIRRNGSPLAAVGAVTTFTDPSAVAGQTHRYVVRAFDRAGNVSPRATVDAVR